MRLIKVAAVAAALSLPLAGAAYAKLDIPSGTYLLDPNHASLHWKVDHLGLSKYTARFTEMKAVLELDSDDPTKSKITATIYPASLRTDYPNADVKDFDKKLQEEKEFFDATQFPEITFTSTKLTETGPNSGTMEGELTFLGVTKPVTLDVVMNGSLVKHPFVDAAAIGFSATGSLKRSEFGMTHLIPGVGDEVEIVIEAEFVEKK
ncbi:MAG: YceI family protein [Rhodospirillales bacterium]